MKKLLLFVVLLLVTTSLTGCSDVTPSSNTKYYFKDNVAMLEDIKIEITSYKVIQPGETGNEYGEKPVIAFWYNTTNISTDETKEISPDIAWIAVFTAIQDNNSNSVNELNVGLLPDDTFSYSQSEKIKRGGVVASAIAYELDDLTTPVLLKAHKGADGDFLGEMEFKLQ